MTDEIKVQDAGTADKAKLTVAILVVIGGVAGYYVLAGWPAWLRWTAVAASLALAAPGAGVSYYGREFRQFVELARIELRKIVWPSRQEDGHDDAGRGSSSWCGGKFFWLLDLGLAWATKLITGQGS